MGTTVIDQLIVKLGLDPRDFTKGEKEVAAGVVRTKEVVRKNAANMSTEFEKAAGSFAKSGGVIARIFSKGGLIGLAIAATIAALKIANDKLYEISESTRQLGLDARNFNTSAAGLRNMQNAAELAGGSLEDATQAAAGLSKSLFDLKFNGQISDSLMQLTRLGVQFTDASGKARDFKDIALDVAEALGKTQANGQMSRAEAYQYAQQVGFGGGLANAIADGPAALRAALDQQESRRQVSTGDTAIADERVRARVSLGQAAIAEIGVPTARAEGLPMTAFDKKAEGVLTGGARGFGRGVDAVSTGFHKVAAAADRATKSFTQAWNAEGTWFKSKMRGAAYGPALDAAADKYGVDRDVVRGIARVESGNNPNAVARSKTGKITGKGIMQLNPQFFPNAGKDPYADIDTATKHFSQLLEGSEGSEQERYIEALRKYNAGETNYNNKTNLGPQNEAYAGKVLADTSLALPTPGAQAVNNRTDITFETVNINTPRTDGQAVAQEFTDATRRKMLAAHADAGMQ